MKIKEIFDWLAQNPKHQYTLGSMISESATIPFSRGARALERFGVGSAVVLSGLALYAGYSGDAVVGILGFGKVLGLNAGVIFDGYTRY